MQINRRYLLASGLTLWPLAFGPRRSSFGLLSPIEEKAGITLKSGAAVKRGLKWLKRSETVDGGHGTDINQKPNIGCSAMTGLAFLADGSTPGHGAEKMHLRRIVDFLVDKVEACLLYTSPSPRDATLSRMPSSA